MLAAAWSAIAGSGEVAAGHWGVIARIAGSDGGWDHATIDPMARRFYLARDGVAVLDLDRQQWLDTLAPGARVNGVLALPELHRLLFTDDNQGALVVYDTIRGKIVGSAAVGHGTDAVAYDPKTGLAAVMTGRSDGVVALVDVRRVATVAKVRVGGKLEFPVSDGQGTVFVTVESGNEIAVLDLATRRIVRRVPLVGCDGPGGLAYEPVGGLLVAACDKVAKVIRARDGADLGTLVIGAGADDVIGDPAHRRVFIPSGDSGTLSVIDLSDVRHPRVWQTMPTQSGARIGALDVRTGKLYLPAAQPGPVIPPNPWPSIAPGTFMVLVIASR